MEFCTSVQGRLVWFSVACPLWYPRLVAFAAAESFIGERPTTINNDIIDLVGELANMIGGGAKERLDMPGVVLGLPTTVSGCNYKVSFNPDVEIETVRFQSPSGDLTVQIAMGH